MGYSKEKQERLVKALDKIATLVGQKGLSSDGRTIGLDMTYEQNKCQREATAVRDGLFKVVVMGTFSCGKSTVINSLIGAKVLPESIRPCTAILTFIQYGQDEDVVEVYMKDKVTEKKDGDVIEGESIVEGKVRRMTVAEFNEEFCYSLEDEKECMATGTVSRFADVDYAVMRCSRPMMEGGVRIIDSPGLEDKAVATELSLQMASEAQAIIYIATEKGFGQDDKEYILNNFKNCPNNVFFVLNRMDILGKKDRQEILELTKLFLQPVFKLKDGTVDENLLNRRLFGISALRAIDARRGYAYDKEEGEDVRLSEAEREKLLETSCFVPFENELEHFLTTDEKCIAQYQSAFHQMADTYRAAGLKIEADMNVFESRSHITEEQKAECAQLIDQISSSIKLTEQTFDNCSLQIQNTTANLVNKCTANIDDTWEQDLVDLRQKVNFQNYDYMKIAIGNINIFKTNEQRAEALRKALEPFGETVARYLTDKIQNFFAANKSVIEKAINDAEAKLNTQLARTDELISDLGEAITNKKTPSNYTQEQSWLQTVLSFMLSDISASVLTAAGGKLSWMEYLKRSVVNYIWQFLLVTAGGGVGGVIAIVIEAFQMNNNRKQFIDKMLSGIKDQTVASIRSSIGAEIDKVNDRIAIEMHKAKGLKCGDEYRRLVDEKHRLENLEKTLADVAFDAKAERNRCEGILSDIAKEASESYEVVMGKSLSLNEFIYL